MDKCEKCGAPIENGKCTYCGAVVQTMPPQPTYAPNYSNTSTFRPQTVVNVINQNNVYNRISPKNRGLALVLAIFLGFYGIHNFYVGKIGMGILYLFTAGLFGIGWIVDIIRIAAGCFKDSKGLYLK